MKRGDQIAYIPDHVKNIPRSEWRSNSSVEFGFINALTPDKEAAFCRYWNNHNLAELRTIANSERTSLCDIVLHESVQQSQVDAAIAAIDKGVY